MKLSIIIPAYNEEKRIGATLEKYLNFFESREKKLNYEIIVVINNTTDNTERVVKKFIKKGNVKIINIAKGGKANAIVVGFKDAILKKADLIGFVDADCSTPPEAFSDLVKNIRDCDAVIPNRWDKKSKIDAKQSFLRRFASRVFNFIVRSYFFLNFRDTQCGAKLIRRKALEKVINKINITQWAFDVALIYYLKKDKFVVKDIPTIWEDKLNSKLDMIKAPHEMFIGITRLRLINSPFNFIIRAYDLLPNKLKIHLR